MQIGDQSAFVAQYCGNIHIHAIAARGDGLARNRLRLGQQTQQTDGITPHIKERPAAEFRLFLDGVSAIEPETKTRIQMAQLAQYAALQNRFHQTRALGVAIHHAFHQ